MMNTRWCIGLFTLGLLILVAGCSASDGELIPVPGHSASGAFSVELIDGAGNFTPELAVTESVDCVTVALSACRCRDLTDVTVHLNYDESRYSPRDVEFTDFLGGRDEVLTLALTDRAGYVPLGLTQLRSSGVRPRMGTGVVARVRFNRQAYSGSRGTSYFTPSEPRHQVDDLTIIGAASGTVDLFWTETNTGDYDNNGLVSVSDLTPIGQFFNVTVNQAADPERVALIDGNGNGLVEVSDLSTIGQNYENQVSGYSLFTDALGTVPYGTGITLERETAKQHADNVANPLHAVKYYFTATLPGGTVEFTVRPVSASDSGTLGTLSNPATPIDDVDPEPPSAVTAASNATTGHLRVQISWTASPSTDVRDYVIERQLDSVPDVWTEVTTIGKQFTSVVDDDMTKTEAPYTYRVKAVDYTDRESAYATSDPVTPYVVFVAPPTNVAVHNNVPTPQAINVTWDPPADDSGIGSYKVYNADTLAMIFTSSNKFVYEYLDTGLTPGVTYNYYVTSVATGGAAESAPSATVGTTPSTMVEEINILTFTTNKTTHNNVGTEGPCNLNVTTDLPATSVDWSATSGSITGTGQSVTWTPTSMAPPQKITVTVTVHRGTGSDTDTLYLYTTTAALMPSMGDGGAYIDFSGELLNPLSMGGTVTPGVAFSSFVGKDHVILLAKWEVT